MIDIALVVHAFPSPTHPYITEWVRELQQQDVNVTVLTEQLFSKFVYPELFKDTNPLDQTHLLNTIAKPWDGLLQSVSSLSVKPAYWQRLTKTYAILRHEYAQNNRRIGRKLYEYVPLMGRHFDIVHFNAPQIAIRRFELGRIFEAKTIVSFRGQDFTFHPNRYDRLLDEADHLHFISQHLIDEANKRGYKGDKHTLIPPLVDTNFYFPPETSRQPTKEGLIHLFTAARFEWTKGWEYALQAVALLVSRGLDIHYYIAGDGSLKETVAYTIDQLGLQNRVHMLGWLAPQAVREQLWNSDIYLLTSVNEAFNNSVLQAQACGVPVVCSDAGGLPENIRDGVTGLLAQRRDAWDTADQIETLIINKDLYNQMKRNGPLRVKMSFSLDQLVKAFSRTYSEVNDT